MNMFLGGTLLAGLIISHQKNNSLPKNEPRKPKKIEKKSITRIPRVLWGGK